MKDSKFKTGVYFNRWNVRQQQFGVGVVWDKEEKYFHINVFNFELAIGRTGL